MTARKETLAFVKYEHSTFPAFTGINSLKTFSWEDFISQLNLSLPTVISACAGCVSAKRYNDQRFVDFLSRNYLQIFFQENYLQIKNFKHRLLKNLMLL